MSKGTLIMMHGMTGTSEKMEELARGLTPRDGRLYALRLRLGTLREEVLHGGFSRKASLRKSRFPKWKTHYQESWRLYQKVR